MRHFFVFLGVLGVLLLMGLTVALFIGVPSHPKEVVKLIDVKR